MISYRKLSFIALICVILVGCEKQPSLAKHDARLYTCLYSSSWKLNLGTHNEKFESIEFDLGAGRLIFLTAYPPENPTTLDRYCEIVTNGFPKNHHRANPTHTVTTEFSAKPAEVGPHQGLSTKFVIDTPEQKTGALYRFFRFASDDYLIFVELFEEDHLRSMPEKEISAFLSSIQSRNDAESGRR